MISNIKGALHRVNPLVVAATLILAALIPVLAAERTSALALVNRSLMVSSTVPSGDVTAPDGSTYTFGAGPNQVPAGDPRNGTKVDHLYTFNAESGTDIGGFTIEYCTTAFAYVGAPDVACSGPAGFSGSTWATGTVTVTNVTTPGTGTFTVAAPSANYLELTSGTPLTVNPNDQLTINFPASETRYFANPTAVGTYFGHISTYALNTQAQAGTPVADNGTVTSSTAEAISIQTRVQETLNFSVEGEDNAVAGPTSSGSPGSCDPLTQDGLIYMGDTNNALSATQTYTANSYFRLATNSANGTKVYYSGDTLKSGSNAIDGLTDAAPVASDDGNEQFGLALDLAASTMTQLTTVPAAYADAENDNYAFDTGSVADPVEIAASDPLAGGIVACDTGHVEYVANIATNTPAGIYTTKISYIAAPSY